MSWPPPATDPRSGPRSPTGCLELSPSVYDAYDHVDYCFANAGVISIGSCGNPEGRLDWLWQTNTMAREHHPRVHPRMIEQPRSRTSYDRSIAAC